MIIDCFHQSGHQFGINYSAGYTCMVYLPLLCFGKGNYVTAYAFIYQSIIKVDAQIDFSSVFQSLSLSLSLSLSRFLQIKANNAFRRKRHKQLS